MGNLFNPLAKMGFDNWPFLRVWYWPFVRSDGSAGIQSHVQVWDGVCIVALDEKTHEVYVLQQKRVTPAGEILTTEIPGGGIDPHNTPMENAVRELLEEVGVQAVGLDSIRLSPEEGWHPNDGLVSTSQHLYLLLCGRKVQEPEHGETISVTTLPLSKLIEMDDAHEFRDPLVGYYLRHAESWLRKSSPALLT